LVIEQYGVIAYRVGEDGEPRLLLITSRDTGRWVVPRGNPMPGLPPHAAAAEEAWEEAGVRGTVSDVALGHYRYAKRRRFGTVPAAVTLFALQVEEEHEEWPERGQRERRWFAPAEAAAAVEEEELKGLILAFPETLSRN
jgi:8-oxo-dGTP pyrophosphatase MutT (NUDIX family)